MANNLFAVVGAGGYIAPKHFQAIYDTGNEITDICDINGSVGIIDRFNPEAYYHSEFDSFIKHIEKHPVDYISICTPNYLHFEQAKEALSVCDVILEKPPVVSLNELDSLMELEKETGHKVYPVFQLRLFDEVKKLEWLKPKLFSIEYHVKRGSWYNHSWKGITARSGGLIFNIGCHPIDLAIMTYGVPNDIEIVKSNYDAVKGILYFTEGTAIFDVGINKNENRGIYGDSFSINLSGTINSLHKEVYDKILSGNGIRLSDVRNTIITLEKISKLINL